MTPIPLNDDQIVALARQIEDERTTRKVIDILCQFYGSQVQSVGLLVVKSYTNGRIYVANVLAFDTQGRILLVDRNAPGWPEIPPNGRPIERCREKTLQNKLAWHLTLVMKDLLPDIPGMEGRIQMQYDLTTIGKRFFLEIRGIPAQEGEKYQ